ncbi:MAG TPA: FtsX-like permease family protein [Phycisphaerae bacterium]|nr:FtsX-like permease family protein [Phycisphaerae bacterium]
MRHWWQLGTRNWRAKPGRTAGAVGAIALGVGVVVWVTCAYESVRLALSDQVWFWIGRSHLSVDSVYGEQGTVFQSIADEAAGLKNVAHVTYRLKYPMTLERLPQATSTPASTPRPQSELPPSDPLEDLEGGVEVQAIGIRPELESIFRQYDPERVAGRMIEPGENDAAVVDRTLATEIGLKIGDQFRLRAAQLDEANRRIETSATFTVVGLLEHRRIAKQQSPAVLASLDRVQALAGCDGEPRQVTKIDLILKDTTPKALTATELELHRLVGRYAEGFVVNSAATKLKQVEAAERQTQFIMLLISTVALFTAFFIILSTLSMGMVERLGQLGTLRCLGMTRAQVAALMLGEAVALGATGIILGIPVGLGLGQLTVHFAREYIGYFAISRPGLVLAVAGGALTTLAGALLPMLQTMRVSPLAASRPQSQPTPGVLAWICGMLGVGMIAGHVWMITHIPANRLYVNPELVVSAVALLYCGYAFVVPAAIRVVGALAVRLAAGALRLRPQLLADQVGKAVWRSSAICCGLMVGLSLIVTLVVHSESIAAGWNFPKQFCEAFVYISPPVEKSVADKARRVGGIGPSCLVNPNIRCTIYGKGLFNFPFSLFIAGDPDEFFRIANLEFVEGNAEEAIAKLRKGGHVLVTPEFVRSKNLGYGQKVTIRPAALFAGARQFEIAGVVTSPALDIAANYFNAGDMLISQSVHVVLGTFSDARKAFGVRDEASLFLFNFDLAETAVPPEFAGESPPDLSKAADFAEMLNRWSPLLPERAVELEQIRAEAASAPNGRLHWLQASMLRLFRERLAAVAGEWSGRSPEQRWQAFREELAMGLVVRRSGANWEQHGSVRELKQRIDRDLRRATRLFAAIPMVALIVAALGVGNLMMANVASRSRQIATLRAVGATRWQIMRLVTGEALVLGTLGCAVGVALGLHGARSINWMVEVIWGYQPVWTIPYPWVALSIGFTLLVCLLAGVIPATRAARSNIIKALHTT